jgi:hypothetical protein
MTKIEGVCLDVCEATEFVTIVTIGDDGPHVVGNWGDYMRVLGIRGKYDHLPCRALSPDRKKSQQE